MKTEDKVFVNESETHWVQKCTDDQSLSYDCWRIHLDGLILNKVTSAGVGDTRAKTIELQWSTVGEAIDFYNKHKHELTGPATDNLDVVMDESPGVDGIRFRL